METHLWILTTLQDLAGLAKTQRMERAVTRLKFVADVYAEEVCKDEPDRIETLAYLTAEIERIASARSVKA